MDLRKSLTWVSVVVFGGALKVILISLISVLHTSQPVFWLSFAMIISNLTGHLLSSWGVSASPFQPFTPKRFHNKKEWRLTPKLSIFLLRTI